MTPEAAPSKSFLLACRLTAFALFALRFAHLGGPLDDPHSWRQCDTAFYSRTFARESLDLLHPSVCWLGPHRVLLLELPLPEAASALLQRAFGLGFVWDRVVALAFFGIATLYLHRIARTIAGTRPAWLATLAWLAFPLGQFYSRAAHVDFAAVAFAHAFLDHAMRAFRGSRGHAVAAGVAGALAAGIKAPYLLPLLPPLALAWLAAPTFAPSVVAFVGVLPAVAFALWRRHVVAVNAAAPDWDFLPGYYKETSPLWWYFGSFAQRFDPSAWIKVGRRLAFEALTPTGALVALPALAWRPARRRRGAEALPFLVAWLAGTLLYLLVFFPLNVIHDYYQIPFLAPFAIAAGLGLDVLLRRPPWGVLALVGFLAWCVWAPRTLGFYRIDWLREAAGHAIAARVPDADLVVAADHGSGYSDPRLLQRADRFGWSVAIPDLTPDRMNRLRALGARWLAVVTDPDHPELREPPEFANLLAERVDLWRAKTRLGSLALYDLRRQP